MAKIPKFDRREVDAARLAFSGSVDDNEQILHLGDEGVAMVKYKVTGVAFKENQFGVMRRVHTLSIDHAIPADETTTKRVEKQIRDMEDDASGQTSLNDEIDGEIEGDDG